MNAWEAAFGTPIPFQEEEHGGKIILSKVRVHLNESNEIVSFEELKPRAGQVVYRRDQNNNPEIVLCKQDNESMWELPKGRLEDGEDPQEGSSREVHEETGLETEVEQSLGSVPYFNTKIYFFLARYVEGAVGFQGDVLDGDWENSNVQFFPLEKAKELIIPKHKVFLDRAEKIFVQRKGN